MGRLDDVRTLVTGGTSGIGRVIVARLAGEGARVVFTGRDAERGAAVASETGAAFVRRRRSRSGRDRAVGAARRWSSSAASTRSS